MVPEPGWTTKAKVVQVYDGDTIVVDVTRRFRVRLLDCWAPEVRTRNDSEKKAGFASRDNLAKLLPVGSTCTVAIPSSVDGELQDVLTMGRFLAHVWSDGGVNVSESQVKAGHATRAKGS
jgi:endonuclease YncB( thermonuclease family)